MLKFYRTVQGGGYGERPHATYITGNSVLYISRMALPEHVILQNLWISVVIEHLKIYILTLGVTVVTFYMLSCTKKHLINNNNPNWKFAEEYDPATYDVYGLEAIPSFAKSLEHKFPKVHIVNAEWNESGKEVSISIDPNKKNSNWGSSLIKKWSRDNVTVNTLDFAAFMMERVCLKDNVHLKLNIEGSEYVVMDH